MNGEDKSSFMPGREESVTSFRNPLVKRIRRLRHKKYRQKEGAFFVEGLRGVLTAFESGATLDTIVYNSDQLTSEVARQALKDQQASGVPSVSLSSEIFRKISDRDNPVGLGVIVKARPRILDQMAVREKSIFVSLLDVAEPGNLGTILRTIDAVGADGLILVGTTVDLYHPTAVKASMGALFTVPIAQADTIDQLIDWAGAHEIHPIATSAHAGQSFWEAEYRRPALLLLGSEREGLPGEFLSSADQLVSIPMTGSVSSLNLAVAAGLLLYELRRRSP